MGVGVLDPALPHPFLLTFYQEQVQLKFIFQH